MTKPLLPLASQVDEPLAPVRSARWSFGRRRGVVVRRGLLATVLAPLASAIAVLAVVLGLAAIGTNWWAGYSRDRVFTRAVQPDGSAVAIDTGRPLEESVTVLLRDGDGELRRLVVERDAADRFVNETLRQLDQERVRSQKAAAAEMVSLMDAAFAHADLALERHADWFFSWKRSFVVLEKAVVAAAARLLEPGDYEPLQVAVARDLEGYFMRHYEALVLQPELRGPMIDRGFEAAARLAHERWLLVLARQDRRLHRFLAAAGRPLDQPAADARLSRVALDWDAQRFKAPRHLTGDKAFDGLLGVARVGAATVAGAALLRPVAQRAGGRVLAGLARRQAATLAGRLAMAQGGATLGTAVQPGGGTAVGALAGGLLGLGLDYLMNELDAAAGREAFVAAHRAALDATRASWQDRLTAELDAAIDRWFADARAAVVRAG